MRLRISRRLRAAAALFVCGAFALSACAGPRATNSSPLPDPSASQPSADAEPYSTETFALPLSVTVGSSLQSPPAAESTNMVSWNAIDSPDEKVRLLVPVVVYPPGSAMPEPPPQDYLSYLRQLAAGGAELSHETQITVDGHPATLVNLTSASSGRPDGYLDGSLGCPSADSERAEGCFGPQPELLLRIAVVDVGGTTLLAWARMNRDGPDPSFVGAFEQMLATIRFQ